MSHADLEAGNTTATTAVPYEEAHAELRAALAWYLEVVGIRQSEAIDLKLTLLAGNPLLGTPGKSTVVTDIPLYHSLSDQTGHD